MLMFLSNCSLLSSPRKYYKRLKHSFTQFWALMMITRNTIKRRQWRKVRNGPTHPLHVIVPCLVSWQPCVYWVYSAIKPYYGLFSYVKTATQARPLCPSLPIDTTPKIYVLSNLMSLSFLLTCLHLLCWLHCHCVTFNFRLLTVLNLWCRLSWVSSESRPRQCCSLLCHTDFGLCWLFEGI